MKYYIYDIDLTFIGYGNENQIQNYIDSGYIVSIIKLA